MTRYRGLVLRATALTSLLTLSAAGCSLFFYPGPVAYRVVDCRATLVSEEGAVIPVVTGWDQGFPRRRYFVCEDDRCDDDVRPAVDAGRPVPFFEEDWMRYAHRQAGRIADGTLDFPESPFARLEGPWCVEEASVRCESSDTLVVERGSASDPDFVLQPLDDPGTEIVCAPPAAAPACLEIECGDEPCSTIDFGPVPLGEVSEPVTVRLSHCGPSDAPPVVVRADGAILPDGLAADFAAYGNSCLPDTPEEQEVGAEILAPPGSAESNSSCTLAVRFEPESAFAHAGTLRIVAQEELVDIPLTGSGIGGALAITDAASGAAVESLCFEVSQAVCAPPVTLLLVNQGPGLLTVQGVEVEGPAFSVAGPQLAQLPWQLDAAGPGVPIEIEGCTAQDKSGALSIISDQPGVPATTIPMSLNDSCP